MAGGDHHSFKVDPAVERWQAMHSSMHERFRFTPSKTRSVLIWALAVPFLTYQLASYTDNRWNMRAKTREESLLRVPPKQEQPESDK